MVSDKVIVGEMHASERDPIKDNYQYLRSYQDTQLGDPRRPAAAAGLNVDEKGLSGKGQAR